ncbi:hypothetical protein [Sediminibacterium soli]|uniref:hypothetical protein n=1 Tax=Sediminibacterium soli TaxID=2698829 RepID=UPI00137AAEB2|nr:hypothetical protein [Sediminibacterium soli]NCI47773.1 hypothetical protein [Sediminibacterium soli]
MSKFLSLIMCAALVMLLCSGKVTKHSVWLVVNNTSVDGKPVDMKFSILAPNQERSMVETQQVNPGIQLLPEKKLKEGPYQFVVNTNGEQVAASQAFTVDSDRWILVNYLCQDSASIMKTYGYIDPTKFKKVGDQYATVYLSIESRKPAGL